MLNFSCVQQFSRLFWHISVAATMANFASGTIFYDYNLEKPSFLVTFLAIYYKYGAGIFYAFMIFGLIYRLGWFFPNIFNHPVWAVTGKISFAGYIYHNFVVQLLVMDIYQPIVMDAVKFVS